MPKRGDRQINSFTKGLITEVSPLSFPEGASLDELNMKLKKDGTRERRLGMDYESGFGTKATGLSASVLSGARLTAYRWSQASGNTHTEIGVIQVGNSLYFIDLLTSTPSANYLNGGNPLTFTGVDNAAIFNFATINNWLIIVSSGLTDPYAVSYDKDTDTITSYTAPVMVRDLWGVHDNLGENDRPTTLSPEHHYNLRNQGWDDSVVTTCGAGINAINCTFNTFGVYPGNGDQWSIGRVEDLTSADVDKYNPNIAARNLVNTGQVARGHYVIPLFKRGQSRIDQTGLLLKADQELGRFTTIASYAGRIFYSGILSKVYDGDNRSPKLSGAVFFSQTFSRLIDLVKCYTEADPTNPDFNEVIDTDGGYIIIPECSVINALKPIKQSLFVFAENGVWEIRGDDGGFRATSFQVNKISNIGVYSAKSIVEVNGVIYFWGNSGIYAIAPNQFGTFDTNNITLQTIQRLYNSIPDSAKKNARAYHDNHTNTIRWLFYSGEEHQIGEPIEIVPPAAPTVPSITGTGIYVEIDSASMPEVARISSTEALVIYRKVSTGFNSIHSKVLTMASDLSLTSSADSVIASVSPSNLTGYDIVQLTDNKIFLVYSDVTNTYARIGNYSAGTFTWTAATTINSEFIPVITTSKLRVRKISANKVIVCSRNSDNSKPTAQIVDIDASDVITFGAVAKSGTETSIANPNIVLLDSGKAVMCWNSFANSTMEKLSISGSTITFHGTSYSFPVLSQVTGATNIGGVNNSMWKIDSTHFLVIMDASWVISAVTHYGQLLFTVTEASGVLTSTSGTKLEGVTKGTSFQNVYPTLVGDESDDYFRISPNNVHSSQDNITFAKITASDPPGTGYEQTLENYISTDSTTLPDAVYMGSSKYITVYWEVETGTSKIKAIATLST